MNNIKNQPTAGDVVIILKGSEQGHMACVNGIVGDKREKWHICANFSAFNDGNIVSCSGGSSFTVSSEKLVDTGRTHIATFWKWKDGTAGAGNGEDYQKEVTLWSYEEEKAHHVYDALSVKDMFYRKSLQFDSSIITPKNDGNAYEPMRGDYVFTNMVYPESFGVRRYCDTDGETLFSAAQHFKTVYLFTRGPGHVSDYRHIVTVDSMSFTAFRTDEELDAFIDAYKLVKVERSSDDQFFLIPNMDVNTWSQVHWRKISKKVA
jgi:hypothetical protein